MPVDSDPAYHARGQAQREAWDAEIDQRMAEAAEVEAEMLADLAQQWLHSEPPDVRRARELVAAKESL